MYQEHTLQQWGDLLVQLAVSHHVPRTHIQPDQVLELVEPLRPSLSRSTQRCVAGLAVEVAQAVQAEVEGAEAVVAIPGDLHETYPPRARPAADVEIGRPTRRPLQAVVVVVVEATIRTTTTICPVTTQTRRSAMLGDWHVLMVHGELSTQNPRK